MNHYLEILELTPGATPQEVKSAYRRLSKKYHPDLNDDPDAHDQFVALTEAYNFLTSVGPTPAQEQVAYDYDPLADEYEVWRKKARQSARKKAQAEAMLQQLLIKRLIRGLNYILGALCLFNLLLAVDYFLPRQTLRQEILSVSKVYTFSKQGPRSYHSYDEVVFTDFAIRFAPESMMEISHYDEAYVRATRIFQKPMEVGITIRGQLTTHHPLYTVYQFFGYLIPAILMMAGAYFLIFKAAEPKFTMGLLVTIVAIIQLVFFFRS